MSLGELGLDILRQQAAALLAQAPVARVGEDPEGVHQTRVATRRMRAALRLFDDVLPREAISLNDDLRWIAGTLGRVRDLDVQVHRLRDTAAALGVSHEVMPYGAWLEAQRQRAQATVGESLGSQHFQGLAERLRALDTLRVDPHTDLGIDTEGPRRLERAYATFSTRARKLTETSPAADFHAERIRAKRLRYAAEFFAPVYGRRAEQLAKRAVVVQDMLGDHQDGVVSSQRIHEAVQTAAGAWPAETSLALGQVLQLDAQHGTEIRKAFPAAAADLREKGWKPLKRVLRELR